MAGPEGESEGDMRGAPAVAAEGGFVEQRWKPGWRRP
jgi:hypothetical protein